MKQHLDKRRSATAPTKRRRCGLDKGVAGPCRAIRPSYGSAQHPKCGQNCLWRALTWSGSRAVRVSSVGGPTSRQTCHQTREETWRAALSVLRQSHAVRTMSCTICCLQGNIPKTDRLHASMSQHGQKGARSQGSDLSHVHRPIHVALDDKAFRVEPYYESRIFRFELGITFQTVILFRAIFYLDAA